MNNKVLLIGNGINNVNQDYTWFNLIDNLINYIGAAGQIIKENKPFPLLYEEIFVEAVKNRGFSEINIKEFIANETNKLKSNEIHREIINIGVNNILTTNYDFTFEKQLTSKIVNLKNIGLVKESTYSIFRHFEVEGKKIWHIHGDGNSPLSIALGYEHYSGYLQQMRNYVATGTTYKNTKLSPLIKRLNPVSQNYSWLDFFFKNDVYIIGLTLDFIEIHLWWLLTYRQRSILTKGIKTNNKIVYFYPDTLSGQIQNKIQLLKSNGILAVSCKYDESNRILYYKEVLNKIKSGT